MSLREKIRRNAASLLEPGEAIQAVIPTQTTKGGYGGGGPYNVLIATDRRLLYCKSGWFRMSPVRRIVAAFPRETRIGPADELLWHEFRLPVPVPLSTWIHRRFFKDIAEADAAERQATAAW